MANILVIGRKAEGKSTLALYLVQQQHESNVIFDPRGIFEGDYVISTPDELEDCFEERCKGIIVYQPEQEDTRGAFEELADVLCPRGRRSVRGGYGLIVDEAGGLQSANSITPGLDRLIKQHKLAGALRSTIIQTSHQLADSHRASKGLMDELYIFRLKAPRDLVAVSEYAGDEVAAIVPKRRRHQCVRVFMNARDDDKEFELWDDPTLWNVSMGKHSREEAQPHGETVVH